MEQAQLFLLVFVAMATGVMAGRRSLWVLARLRARRVRRRLTCPQRGARVECTVLQDEQTGRCVGIESCSAFWPDGRPRCDQGCVELLNRGVPLERDGEG